MRAQTVVVMQRTSLGLAILSLVGIIEGIIFGLYLSRAITRHLREAIAQLTTSSTEILATTIQVATEVNETTATVEAVRQSHC